MDSQGMIIGMFRGPLFWGLLIISLNAHISAVFSNMLTYIRLSKDV